jgi:hypothetical protein
MDLNQSFKRAKLCPHQHSKWNMKHHWKFQYLVFKHSKCGVCKQGPNKWGEMGERRRWTDLGFRGMGEIIFTCHTTLVLGSHMESVMNFRH